MWRLTLLGLSLAFLTACFEGFETLETTVVLDTEAQVFRVERRLVDVSAAFLGCGDPAGCEAAIGRLRALSPLPTGGPAERLMQRLIDSGAQDLALDITLRDGHVDAVVRYVAPLGSAAADDTFVHAEWEGKNERGDYHLAIDAQPGFSPPSKYRVRRVARSGAAGPEWGESWVLPSGTTRATTSMAVTAGPTPLLSEYPALVGPLGGATPQPQPAPSQPQPVPQPVPVPVPSHPVPQPQPQPVPVPSHPVPQPQPVPVPVPVPSHPVPQPPVATLAPPAPAPKTTLAWAPPDPSSPARTFVFDPVITGGALSAAAAAQTVEPLKPRFARCWQDRQAAVGALTGTAFVSAVARPDGFVVTTSVFGKIADRPLMSCLESAITDWVFPAFPGTANSEVVVPMQFSVEAPPGRKRR